jgi:adenylosuccinate lyase
MITRYTRPEMGRLFTDQHKYETWLAVELAVADAWARRGAFEPAVAQRIRDNAGFSIERINELEGTLNHDVLAFTTAVGEHIGDDSAYFHKGLTSSDVVDTAQSIVLRDAGMQIEVGLTALKHAVGRRALEHKTTPCIGRTHGVHAEPTTFGLRLLVWYDELGRHEERLARAIDDIAVGKLSGAVGNFAHLPPDIEEEVLADLGLSAAPVSNQVVQRDRHAHFICVLAGIGATLEKIAVNLRTLQRTEIGEIQEPFGAGQKGSSAMPHKKNPIMLERITGLARVLRGYSVTALENVALWDERDISHSGAERIILPDACIACDYALHKLAWVVENMEVRANRMMRNIELTGGLIFSQRVMLALTAAGMSREEAYGIVQHQAMRSWEDGTPLLELLRSDPAVAKKLKGRALSGLWSLDPYLANVEAIFARVGLTESPGMTVTPRKRSAPRRAAVKQSEHNLVARGATHVESNAAARKEYARTGAHAAGSDAPKRRRRRPKKKGEG